MSASSTTDAEAVTPAPPDGPAGQPLPPGQASPPDIPQRIRIEASSFCQLRCPSCPTATGAIDEHLGRGFLKAADFARLLDATPGLRDVELSNYGEPFLNPELADILRLAFERGVRTRIANGANLNNARPEMLEAVVRYGVLGITCSIDGATQQTYEIYRRRGDLAQVLANIRTIVRWKRELKTNRPLLEWQMVVFEHNRHEIDDARTLARSLGMKFKPKLSWDEGLAPNDETGELAASLSLPAMRRSAVEAATGEPYLARICDQLWVEPAVNWDGKMLGCCRNFWGDFGANVFTDGLAAALAHDKVVYAKEMLLGRAPPRSDIPCSTCDIYEKRRAAGRWMSRPG